MNKFIRQSLVVCCFLVVSRCSAEVVDVTVDSSFRSVTLQLFVLAVMSRNSISDRLISHCLHLSRDLRTRESRSFRQTLKNQMYKFSISAACS